MSLVVMGINHKNSKLDVLERASIPAAEADRAVSSLRARKGINGAVVLSTCNRVEAYVDARTDRFGSDALHAFFAARLGEPLPQGQFRLARGEDVVRHLFRVVCSLDSLVLGEAQILGQTKAAFDRSTRLDCCSEMLTTLFRDALHLGKRVRAETAIGSDSVSLSTTAFKVACREFPDIATRRVLFIGAGKMARLALAYLAQAGVTEFSVTSRTLDHAKAFARGCNALCHPFDQRYEAIAAADVVFAMTSSATPVVEYKPLSRARKRMGTTGRKLVFVDEAVPRDIAPSCADEPGVTLYNLDALNAIVDDGMAARMAAVAEVEHMVTQAEKGFLGWMQQRSVVPTVKAMYAKGEGIVAQEFAKATRLLEREHGAELTEGERAVLQAYGTAVMKKILHGPTVRLKREAATADSYHYTSSARYLFGLDTFPAGCSPHECDGHPCLEGNACPRGLAIEQIDFSKRGNS